jgi:hypothetical protein
MHTRRSFLAGTLASCLPLTLEARKRKRSGGARWVNVKTIPASTFGEGRGFHTIVRTDGGFAISDYFGQSIAKFDEGGRFLGDIGSLPELSALAYDGNFYAGHANNITKLNTTGDTLARYTSPDGYVWYWCAGLAGSNLYLTSNDGYVYVHDKESLNLITRLGKGLGTGGWGYLGRSGYAEAPRAVVHHNGTLWIADPANDLVQQWGLDGSPLSQFPVPAGSGIRSIVFSGESLWVSHEFGDEAVRYSQTGKPLERVRFEECWGLNFTSGGRMWLSSDSPGREIRAYEKNKR